VFIWIMRGNEIREVIEGPPGGPYRKDFEREPPRANNTRHALGNVVAVKCAQRHLKSSRALYEMPPAMEYLISLFHDACSWVKYELSSNNNANTNIHKGIRLLTSFIHG